MEDLAIQIRDLKKSYKKLHALKGVNINIPKADSLDYLAQMAQERPQQLIYLLD